MEISRDKVMPLGMRDKEFGGEGRKHRKLSRISKEAGHRLPFLLPINMYSIYIYIYKYVQYCLFTGGRYQFQDMVYLHICWMTKTA